MLVAAKPRCDLTYMLRTGVVEVALGGEDFDGLRAAFDQIVQQPRMQSLMDVHIGRHRSQHGFVSLPAESECHEWEQLR